MRAVTHQHGKSDGRLRPTSVERYVRLSSEERMDLFHQVRLVRVSAHEDCRVCAELLGEVQPGLEDI